MRTLVFRVCMIVDASITRKYLVGRFAHRKPALDADPRLAYMHMGSIRVSKALGNTESLSEACVTSPTYLYMEVS